MCGAIYFSIECFDIRKQWDSRQPMPLLRRMGVTAQQQSNDKVDGGVIHANKTFSLQWLMRLTGKATPGAERSAAPTPFCRLPS